MMIPIIKNKNIVEIILSSIKSLFKKEQNEQEEKYIKVEYEGIEMYKVFRVGDDLPEAGQKYKVGTFVKIKNNNNVFLVGAIPGVNDKPYWQNIYNLESIDDKGYWYHENIHESDIISIIDNYDVPLRLIIYQYIKNNGFKDDFYFSLVIRMGKIKLDETMCTLLSIIYLNKIKDTE
jgi:hypothetical protein